MQIIAHQDGSVVSFPPPEVAPPPAPEGADSGGVTRWSRPSLLALPAAHELPRGGVRVRPAAPGSGDLAFIDQLQRKHTKAVGWMPTGQLEGHIAKGHVLVAEDVEGVGPRAEGLAEGDHCSGSSLGPRPSPLGPSPVGYCIGVDKYFKREDTGIIYQMNIEPGRQRGLVGATLLKAMFERCPYGVKLFCCWCAQDLGANYFWEAMGFVPLAFRAGSRKRDRIHIFWQKRIREGDVQTEWWYPSQTGAGALKEDRVVLPIPPGTHWSDAKPRVLPGVAGLLEEAAAQRKQLDEPVHKEARARQQEAKKVANARKVEAEARASTVAGGGLRFGPPEGEPRGSEGANPGLSAKSKREQKVAMKNDPRLVAAARELRDRWMEQVAAQPGLLEATCGVGAKYEVSRRIGVEDAGMREALSPGLVGRGTDVQPPLLTAA